MENPMKLKSNFILRQKDDFQKGYGSAWKNTCSEVSAIFSTLLK